MSNKTNRELYLTTKCLPKIIEKMHLVTFNKIKKKDYEKKNIKK